MPDADQPRHPDGEQAVEYTADDLRTQSDDHLTEQRQHVPEILDRFGSTNTGVLLRRALADNARQRDVLDRIAVHLGEPHADRVTIPTLVADLAASRLAWIDSSDQIAAALGVKPGRSILAAAEAAAGDLADKEAARRATDMHLSALHGAASRLADAIEGQFSDGPIAEALDAVRDVLDRTTNDFAETAVTGDELVWDRDEQDREQENVEADHRVLAAAIHTGLTFQAVSEANRSRVNRWHPGFPGDDGWTGADWANAMQGEAGEAGNIVKKIRRLDTGMLSARSGDTYPGLLQNLADEIGDVYAYLDLLAQFYGLNIATCIRDKFNSVSVREGMPERIDYPRAVRCELAIRPLAGDGPVHLPATPGGECTDRCVHPPTRPVDLADDEVLLAEIRAAINAVDADTKPDALPYATLATLNEIGRERVAQQDLGDRPDGTLIGFREYLALASARGLDAGGAGQLTWRHVLETEYWRVSSTVDPADLRKATIRLAAFLVAWAEAIAERDQPQSATCGSCGLKRWDADDLAPGEMVCSCGVHPSEVVS